MSPSHPSLIGATSLFRSRTYSPSARAMPWLEPREKLTFPVNRQEQALTQILDSPAVAESVILSTCNRTEIYALTASGYDGTSAIIDFLADYHSFDRHELVRYLYLQGLIMLVRQQLPISDTDDLIPGGPFGVGQ